MAQQAIKIAPETKAHTPGPWYVRQNSTGSWEINVSPGEYAQTVAYAGQCTYIPGNQEANARLIAVAPELLAIAEDLLEFAIEERLCFYLSVVSPDGSIDDPEDEETLRVEDERIANIKEVIAKAKGEMKP